MEDNSRGTIVAVAKALLSLSCVDLRRLLDDDDDDDDDDDVDFSTTMVADEHCIADRASKSMKVVNLCIFIIERFFSGSAVDTVLYY